MISQYFPVAFACLLTLFGASCPVLVHARSPLWSGLLRRGLIYLPSVRKNSLLMRPKMFEIPVQIASWHGSGRGVLTHPPNEQEEFISQGNSPARTTANVAKRPQFTTLEAS